MSQHPEQIRQEMDETRDSLTDKISMLEQQVVQTVHGASASVKETVAAVKEAVQETVHSVKESVGDTVDTVKDTFSIANQVERHPWMMMAGGAGVGFAVGYLLNAPAASHPKTSPSAAPRRKHGNGSHREHLVGGGESAQRESSQAASSSPLAEMFDNELTQLKGLAIGALAGAVRDIVVAAAPQTMRQTLAAVIDDFTTKFGGQPIPGKVFGGHECEEPQTQQSGSSQSGSSQQTASSSFHKRQTMTLPN